MPMPVPLLMMLALAAEPEVKGGAGPFAIEVVDDQTGRGVPLVELRTVNEIRLVTDSAGVAAFDEPGLMGREVFFQVRSPGYEFPADGFGQRGKALRTVPGEHARLAIHRLNIAQRLYRITGEGIYRDSLLVGRSAPIQRPLLNADVLGSDSAQVAVFRGRLHWFWGDTNRPGYPLGNFQTTGATSRLPADGGLDPERGVDLDYFTGPDGFARAAAPVPGDGPTWIDGLIALKCAEGQERLFAAYAKVRPSMKAYARGLLEFDPGAQRFEPVARFPVDAPTLPHGHPFRHQEGGVDYVYFADPYPLTRVPAAPESLQNLDRYEAFTCLVAGSNLDRPEFDRDAEGRPRYSWKAGARPVDAPSQDRLIRSGALKTEDALLHLRDPDSGRPVTAHRGSTYWNDYRKRWVLIANEVGGEASYLGEVWYTEADAPTGPWVYARKVATHPKYDFYNPLQHPHFARDGGRILYFEGTYTTTFSGNPHPTPRYDYNQLLYKLDLADPRLALPVAIHQGADGTLLGPGVHPGSTVACFAPDRPGPGTVPVYQTLAGPSLAPSALGAPPLFHALPANTPDPPLTTLPLAEVLRGLPPIACRVWRNPALPKSVPKP